MELKVSAHEPSRSPSVSESNPDEKEISDDDDDDRNHKHRRRDDARSQSLEGDAVEQVFTKPYRRGNKPFENGHIYREAGSQSSEAWKNCTFNHMEKDISAKFDKRRPGFTQSSQGPLDLNQRIRVNQAFSGDPGPIRGRGRDPGHWSQRDSRFSSVDIASQIVQQGSVPPGLFAGRGLPTVSNAYGASWSAFGLVPGIPNGGLDTLHPLGLQGTYRSINPSMNMGMGLARQRCRDFEEQGFCLRGDMCPMEHGVNRIVVEDVQSLSQFNLPVSLQNANLPGAPAGPGPLSASGAPTNSLFSSKALHGKTSKRGVGGNGQGLNDAFTDNAASVGADFYDPDQPLWGNDSQTSPALQSINQSNVKESGPLLDPGPSGNRVGLLDGSNEQVVKSGGTAMGSQIPSSSVLGRISSTKNRTEMRENMVSKASPSNFIHNETIEKQELSNSAQVAPHHGNHNDGNSSLKMQSGNGKSVRKPSQKAQCTLFVNGIPLQQNKRESLISHFHKFGEVIDIHIPLNSERAFVQFSKREEAEAAHMAPDAVMGNRFIKVWWANRDNIPVNKTNSRYTAPIPPRGMSVSSALHNGTIAPASAAVPASDHPKPVIANGPKAPPPSQKKLENLEVLKEELRKKQEMLDQKRNDFRRKLDKLEKQATGQKGEIEPEQVAKRQKLGIVADSTKAATSTSSDPETILSSPGAEVIGNGNKPLETAVPQSSKSTAIVALQEAPVLKQSLRPLAPIGPSVVANRFKLDNRPTAFKIISTLPNDLANVAVLKEHFSPFGDLSKVELGDLDPADGNNDPGTAKYSACVYFTTRHSAEKAFSSGKCWNGHNLQFSWLKSSNRSKDVAGGESPLSTSKGNSNASVGPVVEISKTDSQKPAISGDGESEKLEQKDVDKEDTEPDESNHAS